MEDIKYWLVKKIVKSCKKNPILKRNLSILLIKELFPEQDKSKDISNISEKYAKEMYRTRYGHSDYERRDPYSGEVIGFDLKYAQIQFTFVDGYIRALANMGYSLNNGQIVKNE